MKDMTSEAKWFEYYQSTSPDNEVVIPGAINEEQLKAIRSHNRIVWQRKDEARREERNDRRSR